MKKKSRNMKVYVWREQRKVSIIQIISKNLWTFENLNDTAIK